ncbi:MAG: pyridoxamine 5'-phosphate oxidase [Alphaproteobacteria bacterium]|jgi:pyridoxamine 5'-phosphate oxidase
MTQINIPQADPKQHDLSHFDKPELTADFANNNPLMLFTKWYEQAKLTEISDPNAMSLATIDERNMPDIRIVLLKDFSDQGFTFFTNYNSQKGQSLATNSYASLCFHWKSQLQQVRIQGIVEKIPANQSDAYFATRDRNSQIGAWVSQQSAIVDGREKLLENLKYYQNKFEDTQTIPRPDYWGGYNLQPLNIEYWQNGAFRLHDRLAFQRSDLISLWQSYKLSP